MLSEAYKLSRRKLPSPDVLWSGFMHSFRSFLTEQDENIRLDVSERNLCGHLANRIQRELDNEAWYGYYVDTEYNRNLDGRIKTIMDENMEVINITCDLIVHSRGRNPAHDNLIAIEMKKASHTEEAKQKDRKRLRALTSASYDSFWTADGTTLPKHVCGYSLGLLIVLDRTNSQATVDEYRRGTLHKEHEFKF